MRLFSGPLPQGLPEEISLVAGHKASDWGPAAAVPTNVMSPSFPNDTLNEIETIVNRSPKSARDWGGRLCVYGIK